MKKDHQETLARHTIIQSSSRFNIFEPAGPALSGPQSRPSLIQTCLAVGAAVTFLSTALCLHVQQWLGVPLYFLNHRWYYTWQAVVKQSTALLVLGLNQLRAPTTVRISGDASVVGQIRGGKRLEFDFPNRIVLIANHQIYTDWIFFWWTAYSAGKHGRFFVVLKDSLGSIPVLGSGMKFFSWIFLSRRWDADKVNFEGGIESLANSKTTESMWLLLFPEGTNMSRNARAASQRWSSKSGIVDLRHVLLPRSRGLQCCLQGLSCSAEWLYDCTIAYDGIGPGEYGQEVHSMKRMYVEGCKAPQAHMYWRRFAMKDIPYDDLKELETWVLERWIEKDELLEYFQQHDGFPADHGCAIGIVEIQNWLETVQIFGGLAAVMVVWLTGRLLYSYIGSVWNGA